MYVADAVAAYESFNSGRRQRPVARTACRSTPDDAIWGGVKMRGFRSSFDLHQRRNILTDVMITMARLIDSKRAMILAG
jgi:hypothetical protein